ncbi:MAG TPA: hypothetical protein VHY22_16325 [Chthoniobacteraceae bacterium]|nr:hypothetical protein [Chthoniobacteraceae bacterium]
MQNDLERVAAVERAVPPEGLFAEKDWLISPTAMPVTGKFADELERLGYRLALFVRACNLLYQQSVRGKQPAWIADYLDRGKPPELREIARAKEFRDDLPQVLRPDLVLTEEGYTIAELDNVPGGIGLTGWLNQTYAALGEDVIGGAEGMIDGFRSMLPGGADILVSEEAATYRPEMQWLARQAGEGYRVLDATAPVEGSPESPRNVYRFFELFDLPNIPGSSGLLRQAGEGAVRVTPPFKAYLEEKMWFALFWLRPLRDFWRRELTERHFLKLQEVIPYTWLMDPTPLPQHAVIPLLEIHAWDELKHFSQKQRELILKISGFSETAWGSRGVELGTDLPQGQWSAAIQHALDEAGAHPHILQKFHKGRLIEHPYRDRAGEMKVMQGRVRLCPYYFVFDGKAHLRGALATICPADKKLLHGMRDAILAPARVEG